MRSVYVDLATSGQVQAFVEALTPLEGDFDLVSGRYILDARSLMGIFSLDLTRPLELRVYNDTKQNMEAIRRFVVDGAGDGTGAEETRGEGETDE